MNLQCPRCQAVAAVVDGAPLRCVRCDLLVDAAALEHAEGQPLVVEAARDVIGRVVGRYKATEALGHGITGRSYRARDLLTGGQTVLRLLYPRAGLDASHLEHCERTARAVNALKHPAIAHFIELNQESGLTYTAREHIEGLPLDAWAKQRPPTPTDALAAAVAICEPVAAAHQQGIAHGGLHPGNVVVTASGPRLTGFGEAHLADGPAVLARVALRPGSDSCIAPELQVGSSPSEPADVFALGALYHLLLTGELPSASFATTPRPKTMARGAYALLRRALQSDPSLRHKSAMELLADLRALGESHFPWLKASAAAVLFCTVATLAIVYTEAGLDWLFARAPVATSQPAVEPTAPPTSMAALDQATSQPSTDTEAPASQPTTDGDAAPRIDPYDTPGQQNILLRGLRAIAIQVQPEQVAKRIRPRPTPKPRPVVEHKPRPEPKPKPAVEPAPGDGDDFTLADLKAMRAQATGGSGGSEQMKVARAASLLDKPEVTSKVVAQVSKGEMVEKLFAYTEKNGAQWVYVKTKGGVRGYIKIEQKRRR